MWKCRSDGEQNNHRNRINISILSLCWWSHAFTTGTVLLSTKFTHFSLSHLKVVNVNHWTVIHFDWHLVFNIRSMRLRRPLLRFARKIITKIVEKGLYYTFITGLGAWKIFGFIENAHTHSQCRFQRRQNDVVTLKHFLSLRSSEQRLFPISYHLK